MHADGYKTDACRCIFEPGKELLRDEGGDAQSAYTVNCLKSLVVMPVYKSSTVHELAYELFYSDELCRMADIYTEERFIDE
eukprot:5043237-Pleurochrysis_carterae.AAC.2